MIMGRTLRHRQRLKKKTLNIEKSDYSKIIELLQWLGIRTQLQLFHFEDTNCRGLRTLKKIDRGEVLISVPLDKMISRKVVLQHYPDYPRQWSTQLMLSCFLIQQVSRIDGSQWKIYLGTLPKTYDLPYFDCPHILIPALPRYMRQLIEKQAKLIRQQFQEINKFVTTDMDQFAWAWFTANTRGVYFKDDHDNLALAPFLDMFNHACHVQVQAEQTEKFYSLKALNCCWPKHSQVFINYGPHDNVKLYVEYGFVVPDNPHDCVTLCIEDLLIDLESASASASSSKKVDFIQKHQLDSKLQLFQDDNELVSWSLLACLYVLQNPQVDNLIDVFDQDLSIDHFKIDIEHIVLKKMKEIDELKQKMKASMTKVLPQVLNIQYSICRHVLQMMQQKLSE